CCARSATHSRPADVPYPRARPAGRGKATMPLAAKLAASFFCLPEAPMRLAPLLLCLAVSFPALAQDRTTIPDAALEAAAQLREQALADDTSWRVTESLTTEIGPRLPGSEADARAVEWAQA